MAKYNVSLVLEAESLDDAQAIVGGWGLADGSSVLIASVPEAVSGTIDSSGAVEPIGPPETGQPSQQPG